MCTKTLIVPGWATVDDISELAKFSSMFIEDTKIELSKMQDGSKMYIVNDTQFYEGEGN